jgi:hypothetical protein
MDGSKKRRICGAAALSATAIASLLGAQAAAAEQPPAPPGIVQACAAPTSSDSLATLAFKQGWPSKFVGVCGTAPDPTSLYNWWKKTQ